MTAIITPDDIISIYANAAGLDDCVIQDFICVVNEADACLSGAGYSACICSLIKKYSVAHMIYSVQATDFKSMSSPTGESVTFNDFNVGSGMSGSAFGRMALSLDKSGCVSSIIENTAADRFLVAVGC